MNVCDGGLLLLLLKLEAEETVILIFGHCPASGRRRLDHRKYLVRVCLRYPCCWCLLACGVIGCLGCFG